jgi:surface carbohydrate biosynthesis protein
MRRFLQARLIWSLPKSCPVLIYDREGSGNFMEYLPAGSYEILDVRGESWNIPLLIFCALKLRLGRSVYYDAFIRRVNPILVLTFIDNAIPFYSVANRFRNIKTAFIQNGTRGEVGDVFGAISQDANYRVDLMFVHNKYVGEKYRHFIHGTAIPIGSFKSNRTRRNQKSPEQEKTLLFVSTFIPIPADTKTPIWINHDGSPVLWHQFYAAEALILPFLREYCGKASVKVQICGRLQDQGPLERAYYEQFFEDSDWEFLPRGDAYSSYGHCDSADITVNIDSTLGYEALGRGCKVATFSIRGFSLMNAATKFGWPADLPDNGFCWTNLPEIAQFQRILDNLLPMSDEEWKSSSPELRQDLLPFDEGNKRFTKELRSLGIPVLSGHLA